MCRIAGFRDFRYRGGYDLAGTAAAMRDILQYGGPDDCGSYLSEGNGLALAHRRLSIIELSALGHQPMASDDERIWITYNGEVYNFAEIKRELEQSGIGFRGNSDTEVLLKAYEKWGMEALQKFRGMWAFAIWDARSELLILCRDRIGVKPLYWYWNDGLFLFASELKAFHRHPGFRRNLDLKSVANYLRYGYIPAPATIFQNTYKLKPGTYLKLDRNGNIHSEEYWSAEAAYSERDTAGATEAEIELELERLFKEAFSLRLVSDVPIGMFLSGGIDSSLVTAILQKERSTPLRTFTIGFHESPFNEAGHAKRIADWLGTDHTEYYCTIKEALEIIPRLPEMYDEPFADASAIPTFLVSRLAREQVKVCLSADGGDEFFCGYPKYQILGIRLKKPAYALMTKAASFVLPLLSPEVADIAYRKLAAPFRRANGFKDRYRKARAILSSGHTLTQSIITSSFFLDEDLRRMGLETPAWPDPREFPHDPVTTMMLYDGQTYLPDDILVKVDRAGMAVALENREPLLDHKILEFAASLPLHYKVRNGTSKYILKKILYRYVRQDLVDRPKQGFGIPMYDWFRSGLKPLYNHYLSEERIRREGLFSWEALKSMHEDFDQDRGLNHHKLWSLLMFEMWREKWM